MQDMFEILKEILVSKLKVRPEQVTPEATQQDVELDSLAMVELSLILEKELGVVVSDDELVEAGTVGGIAQLLLTRTVAV